MAVANKGARRPFLQRAQRFLRDARAELRKVSWPKRKELGTYTVVVIFTTVVVSAFIGLIDSLFAQVFRLLARLRG